MSKYKVVERFVSINGEARCAGELACFIRFAGCNLNCAYCDTRWANEKDASYELMSEDEIYAYIKSEHINNVTLTGGEPLLQQDIEVLLKRLACDEELRIEIETNGSIDVNRYRNIGKNITFTIDYKLPGSKMSEYMCKANYESVTKDDAVKLVVSHYEDLKEAKRIIDEYRLTDKTVVYLSSSFNDISPKDIVDFMIENNMNKVKLQLQMHKYIWEPEKRGV